MQFLPTKRIRRSRQQRGMALIAFMLVMFMIVTSIMLGAVTFQGHRADNSGVTNNADNALAQSKQRLAMVTATANAESGVEYTLEWLHDRTAAPTNQYAFVPTAATPTDSTISYWSANTTVDTGYANVSMPTGSFSVRIFPDSGNNTVAGRGTIFMVEVIGYSGTIGSTGTAKAILHANVSLSSLSKYAYLINSEQSGNYWVGGLSSADGPVHTNNSNGNKTNIVWFPGTTNKQLYTWMDNDAFESVSSTANWYKNSTSTLSAPSTTSDYLSIAAFGKPGINFNASVVPLPTTGTLQQSKALGTATATTSVGVQVPNSSGKANAGIFIHGDITNMVLSVTSNVNQVITTTQTDSSTGHIIVSTITMTAPTTVDAGTGATSVQTVTKSSTGTVLSTTTANYTGVPPAGVVYTDGNIGTKGSSPGTGLSGVVADNVVDSTGNLIYGSNLTIATDPSTTGKDINFNGNVTYNTARAKDSSGNFLPETAGFQQNAGILGVVAHNMWLQKYNTAGSIQQNYEVDGATLATGTFDAANYSDSTINGNFYGMGSYSAGLGGFFGVFNGSNLLTAGYNEHHNYDQRLYQKAPAGFPSTGNQYNITSWQMDSTTIT